MRSNRTPVIATAILFIALLPGLYPANPVDTLPERLSNAEFWKLSSTLSEPDGYFHSDNFVSNERSFQHVLADLAYRRAPGSAYIGVGPEQNFTYLLGVRPKIAFIVDIRRQNLLEHLMYKALFELSSDRADFLSRLLSRKRPADVDKNSTVVALLDSFDQVPVDFGIAQSNLKAIKSHLLVNRAFPLGAEDLQNLERIFWAFNTGGANLTYDGPVRFPGVLTGTGVMPTFGELMRETDKEGKHRSFLATEENFRTIQNLQKRNLLIPVVGNFAGTHTLKAVGHYLRKHDATVTAFYTSNVEQYLFMQSQWRDFYENVSALPIDGESVFIRGLIRSVSGEYSSSPALPSTSRYETGLFPIIDLVAAYKSQSIRTYYDILIDRQ
jgi:hypothetical protein